MLPHDLYKQLSEKEGTDKVLRNIMDASPRGISHVDYFREFINKTEDNNKTIIETPEPCYIEHLTCQTNVKSAWFQIIRKDYEGNNMDAEGIMRTTINQGSPSQSQLRPEDLNRIGGESSVWKEGIYDENNDNYVFFLKRPLYAPNGFRIRLLYLPSGSEGENAISVEGSIVYYDYPGGVE